MSGCHPSPTKGIRTLLAKRFQVVEVDGFRTVQYMYSKDISTEGEDDLI